MNPQHDYYLSLAITQIERFTVSIGKSAAWLLILMALTETSVVILRYGFNEGSIAVQESITYLHATVFLLGAAYTLSQDGHVRVDVIYRKANARTRAYVNLFGSILFLLPFSVFLFWVSVPYVAQSWSIMEASADAGGVPGVFLLKTLIPVFCFMLTLQGVAEILKSLKTLVQAETEA